MPAGTVKEKCVRTQGRSVLGAPVRRHRRVAVAEVRRQSIGYSAYRRRWSVQYSAYGCRWSVQYSAYVSRLAVEQGAYHKQASSWAGCVPVSRWAVEQGAYRKQVSSWAGCLRKQAVHGWSCLPLLKSLFIIFMIWVFEVMFGSSIMIWLQQWLSKWLCFDGWLHRFFMWSDGLDLVDDSLVYVLI